MKKIKKGDIVGRISYNKDIFFVVKDIKEPPLTKIGGGSKNFY